jgi:hypothetical protein
MRKLGVLAVTMNGSISPLQALREEFESLAPPVIIFNKSHSGSRLLGRLVEEAGFFMGAHQNESHDSLDLVELVEYLVGRYYPDYGSLWNRPREDEEALASLVRRVFAQHLEGFAPNGLWGWKLCETAYIVPVLDFLFPSALYVHLLRDGRDVAFCDHTSPEKPFWKKIYFDTDCIETWHRLRLDNRAYAERSHVYNAIHWTNSVRVGRSYGAMLRERYLEVRYEDLCLHFEPTARRVLDFIRAPCAAAAIQRMKGNVYPGSVSKHARQPQAKMHEVLEIEKQMLLAFGYLAADPSPPPPRSLRRRIKAALYRSWGMARPPA